MLFTLQDVRADVGRFLQTWLSKAATIGSVYDLYFGTKYNSFMSQQHRFLSLVQALEAYHSRTFGRYELSEEEHKRRKESVLACVPRHLHSWAERKLSSNDKSLPQRVHALLKQFKLPTGVIFPKSSTCSRLVDTVVKARNKLSHGEGLAGTRITPDDFERTIDTLDKLLALCLLHEMGMPVEDAAERIRRLP